MTVPFAAIPNTLRLPFFFAEVDNSRANLGSRPQRTLIIGQLGASATLAANVPVLCEGKDWTRTTAGAGSMLADMVETYRAIDTFGETWLLPLADDPAGVAATGSIAVSGTPTAGGVISLYLGGDLVSVPVTTTMTATDIATALRAAITAGVDFLASAGGSGTTVALTAKNKGPLGNDIDLRLNYRGGRNGEANVPGVTLTLTPMASGATAPSLTNALLALVDKDFDYYAFPYTDTTSLNAIQAFLALRWAWNRQQYGGAFGALRGTFGNLATFGTARNDPRMTVMGFNGSPDPSWRWAAAYCAASAVSLRADPGVPLQQLPLSGIKAPPIESRFAMEDRNTLLFDGISTFSVADDGTVAIERAITTYQKNAAGLPDDSFLDVERMFSLAYVLLDIRSYLQSKYARCKLADDGARLPPGTQVLTPILLKADIVARYRFNAQLGYVQDVDSFKRDLVVERRAGNRGRLDVLWPVVVIDQLRQIALLAQMRNAASLG